MLGLVGAVMAGEFLVWSGAMEGVIHTWNAPDIFVLVIVTVSLKVLALVEGFLLLEYVLNGPVARIVFAALFSRIGREPRFLQESF